MKIQNAFRVGLFGGLGVLVAVAIGTGVGTLATILTYVGAALFLALGIDPAVSFLQRHKFPRWAAIVTVLVAILAVFAGLVLAVIPVIIDQVNNLISSVPDVIKAIQRDNTIQKWWDGSIPWLKFSDALTQVQDFLTKNIGNITGGLFSTVFTIATGVFGVIIVLILTLYFVASLSSIKRGLYQLVPATKRDKFIDIAEQISKSVGRYVIGQGALGLCNGILSFIFFSVLLLFGVNVKYYALLAFIAFLFSLVPLVGTITGSVIISLLVLLFNGWPTVILPIIYYVIYMQVEAYVLSPNIMNRAVRVPGVVVVIAALAGGTLLGVLGALVAIPVAAAVLLIIKQVVVPRQNEL
ncbi:AI-2E family transporter [Lysinimonas soli]|uniref:AI-2E family transporter n=1 Tax=Lysinimonas soli TaxID=1074233 RepID=A0ABW0NU48_9MICO